MVIANRRIIFEGAFGNKDTNRYFNLRELLLEWGKDLKLMGEIGCLLRTEHSS